MRITIHLYRLDPDMEPPAPADIGIKPISLPAADLEDAEDLAVAAFRARLNKGPCSPTAGHVEDATGRVVLRLMRDPVREVSVERVKKG